jgi:hypothetical protein
MVSATGLHGVNLRFLDQSLYFSFKYIPNQPQVAEWTPSRHTTFRKCGRPEIEPWTPGSVGRNTDCPRIHATVFKRVSRSQKATTRSQCY